jgi:hypothetical protein
LDWLQHDGTVAEGPREGTTEGGGERAYLGLDPDGDGDGGRVWSHCRFVPSLIHFITDLLRESVPLFLKRQCDRTLDGGHPYAHGRSCTPTRTTECCGDGPCRRGVVPPYSARPHDCAAPMAVLHVNDNGARKNDSAALAQACAVAHQLPPTAQASARRAPWPGARRARAKMSSSTPPRTANAPTGSTTTVRPRARLARQTYSRRLLSKKFQ